MQVLPEVPHKNGEQFRVVAIGKVGKTVFIGWNDSSRTSPEWRKEFPDGSVSFCPHAEDDLLTQLRGFDPKKIRVFVYRVRRADGKVTMARPCSFCQSKMREFGINPRRVTYTDWDGCEKRLNQYDE